MGPKKKGGKANKLARMTDEQRERYLQHRAAIEEETRRRKEQLIATFMRNKLKREEAFTRINSAKINQHWRHILRKIKCAELQEDVQNLWRSFERVMDQKQRLKEELLGSLEVADRQYSDTLQSHMEVVEKLIGIHSQHINNLQALFNAHLAEYLNGASDEKGLINVTFERENQRLQVIRLTMEMDFNSIERQQQKYERVDKLSEMRRKYKEDWEMLVGEREQKLEVVWQLIQDCLHSYATDTAAKRKTVQRLHNMDQDWLQTLADIQKTSRRISKMKEQAENKINSMAERNESLQKERETLLQSYKTLVERVGKETKKDDEKFQHLVITSGNAIKALELIKNKGEKALAMLVLCERFEVMPAKGSKVKGYETHLSASGKSNKYEDHEAAFDEDDDYDENEDLQERELRVFGKLKSFWRRYNKVLIGMSSARTERDMLIVENQRLRSNLRNYLLEMSRVDSCGAPTGHRISPSRPHTSQLQRFKTTIRVPQRPVSSVSWIPSVPSRTVSPGSRRSVSRASSSATKPVIPSDRSTCSSNSDQWSLC